MIRIAVIIVLCFALFLPIASCHEPTRAAAPAADKPTLFERMFPASATVLRDGQIAGAGAFVSDEGHFITAAHVVHNPADRIELLLVSGQVVPAVIVATDLGHDVALIKADLDQPLDIVALPLADGLPLPGEKLYLIAAPSMLKETFLPGMVARNRLGFNFLGDRKCYTRTLLVAADTMPGSSGGCWVNERGEIVGVQSAVAGDGKASHGIAMIAPASAVRRLIEQQADQPTATLGGEFVGLRTQAHGFNKRFPEGSAGVALHRAFEGGAVADAEVPKDHLITHINAQAIHDADSFLSAVRQRKPGDVIRLTVIAPDSHQVTEYEVQADLLVWD